MSRIDESYKMTNILFFSAPPPATGSTGQTAEQQKLFLILLFVSFMAGKASKYIEYGLNLGFPCAIRIFFLILWLGFPTSLEKIQILYG